MKLDSLGNFEPLYFCLRFTFLLPLLPGAIVELKITNYTCKLQTFCVVVRGNAYPYPVA